MVLLVAFVALPAFAAAEVAVGVQPVPITLEKDLGGKVDGSTWSSSDIKGKIYTLVYVDPDMKDLNPKMEEALKQEAFPKDKYGSIAVINMGATWKPNFILDSILKDKQEKFPNTIYVKDLKKTLVKEWGIADDNYDVLIFDKDGKIIFRKDGQLSDDEIKALVALIRKSL
ncbi:MAG: transcriptional regulator [Oligoflexia bacterium]|nr:transcriptional regulator [Oligoflexia bacterium]MBF0365893.1 transcriptional regulator [Oligoflexia bacterium]